MLGVSVLIIGALGWRLLGPSGTESVRPADAIAFDPYVGDGENDGQAPAAVDGDPNTSWSTEPYGNGDGTMGQKPGVGLVLQLAEGQTVEGLEVTSPTEGWTAEVYVLDDVPTAPIDEEQDPVAEVSGIEGDATFSFGGREGSVVVLWITRVSAEGTVEVAEATVEVAA